MRADSACAKAFFMGIIVRQGPNGRPGLPKAAQRQGELPGRGSALTRVVPGAQAEGAH